MNQKLTCNWCYGKGYYHPRQEPEEKEICDCVFSLKYEDMQVSYLYGWQSKPHKKFQNEASEISKQYANKQ